MEEGTQGWPSYCCYHLHQLWDLSFLPTQTRRTRFTLAQDFPSGSTKELTAGTRVQNTRSRKVRNVHRCTSVPFALPELPCTHSPGQCSLSLQRPPLIEKYKMYGYMTLFRVDINSLGRHIPSPPFSHYHRGLHTHTSGHSEKKRGWDCHSPASGADCGRAERSWGAQACPHVPCQID